MRCCCSGISAGAERQFSEKRATEDLAQYRSKGPGSTTRLLLTGLATAGPLHGGCSISAPVIGGLTVRLLERGLTQANGVDLSSAYVAAGSEEAARRAELPMCDSCSDDRWDACEASCEGELTRVLIESCDAHAVG